MPDRIQPGFQDGDVQIRSVKEFNLHTSAARTASGNAPISQIVGDYSDGLLDIDISVATGTTPSAIFRLETKIKGRWRTVPNSTSAAQTTAGSVTLQVTNFGDEVRLAWAMTGTTPSFTFDASFMAKT
jgi:hypothetical protein